jgi:hypothetical protein
MQLHTARYTPVDNHKQTAQRAAGNVFAMLLFWIIMLGLLSSPIWLPVIVELMVAP